MIPSMLENAAIKLARFNDEGLHYNLVANQIYQRQNAVGDPFNKSFPQYIRYIVAGLIVFDMGRMMGSKKYDFQNGGFASRLESKLHKIRPLLEPLMNLSLPQIDLQEHRDAIMSAYETLSDDGSGALHENQKKFHVGATKILHFLNPELFIIVDSNAARAFRTCCDITF
jgi:hypothetical protein